MSSSEEKEVKLSGSIAPAILAPKSVNGLFQSSERLVATGRELSSRLKELVALLSEEEGSLPVEQPAEMKMQQ